jgi:hypothetical protein
VWLISADASGEFTGWIHGLRFGASLPDISYGLVRTSDGREITTLQSRPTPGAANAGPLVGPVILSELAPARSLATAATGLRDSFVELANISSDSVALFDSVAPQRTWHLRGDVEFNFPDGIRLAPGERILVVEFDPELDPFELAGFRARHRVSETVCIFGPWRGAPGATGFEVRLMRPAPRADGAGPEVAVEAATVSSDSAAVTAAGFRRGFSLSRRLPWSAASDPAEWIPTPSTPGEADDTLDGVPDEWARQNGLQAQSGPVDIEHGFDTDSDGFSDRAEQRNGTDPRNASGEAAVRVYVSRRGVVTGFLDATPGRAFTLESNDGFQNSFWTEEQILTVPADGTLVVSFETRLRENRFFRLTSRN